MDASYRYILRFLFIIAIIPLFFGCYPALIKEAEKPQQALRQVRFFYPKFQDDMDLASIDLAIHRNLAFLDKLPPEYVFHYGPDSYTSQDVINSQKTFLRLILDNPNLKKLNEEIRKRFLVYKATGRVGNRRVLFTGYFEPVFDGSLKPDETYKYPIYRQPDDLIKIDLSLFREEFEGKTIVARIKDKEVLPYYSRAQIEGEKVLEGKGLEIAWLKDPLDVTFLHIQGSGRIRLPGGETISVGYQASNGHPYQSIGRYMLEKQLLSREEMSMQGIRDYLSKHPEIMGDVLNQNPSYIFFRVLDNGPLGNLAVPLTPGRSLALDSSLFPKGALCFISSRKPVVDSNNEITGWRSFSRFVLNQDTGGAIKGAGRGDIFWGSGPYAEVAAGNLQDEGELFVLIEKP